MRFVRFTTQTLETFATTRRRVKRLIADMSTGGTATTPRDGTILPISLFEGDVADDRPIDCDRDPAADSRIPTGFTITANAAGTMTAERTWTIPHPRPVPVLSPDDSDMREICIDARTRMNHAGWLIEEQIGDLSSWPSYRRPPQFPAVASRNASHLQRPYGFLDFLDWEAVRGVPLSLVHWQNAIILAATSEFPSAKITRILKANRSLNGGGLLSDDPTDVAYTQLEYRVIGWPAGTLVPGSRDLAPEVDHILPRSMTGTSTYSNAQVVSGKHNNNKRAKVSAQQLQQLTSVLRGTGRTRKVRDDKLKAAEEALITLMKSKVSKGNEWVVDHELRRERDWFLKTYVVPLAQRVEYSRRELEKMATALLRAFHIDGW